MSLLTRPCPPSSTLFPYTTLFRSVRADQTAVRTAQRPLHTHHVEHRDAFGDRHDQFDFGIDRLEDRIRRRSEEHTSELQSREKLVCRLLLEKKKLKNLITSSSI